MGNSWVIELDHGPTMYKLFPASESLAEALALIKDKPDGYGFPLESVSITRMTEIQERRA